MNKKEIFSRHRNSYQEFIDYISSISESDYAYNQHGEKWDAGQHLDHINRAVSKLSQASVLPKLLIKWKFGKSNRPSKTYDELVAKYSKGIAAGFQATGPFLPDCIAYTEKERHFNKLLKNIKKIEKHIGAYSEDELDTIIVRHPAMGLLTMRELLFFNTHHVEDHLRQVKRNLKNR